MGPGELKLTQLNLDCLSRKALRYLHRAALHTFAEHNVEMPGMFWSERPASQSVTPVYNPQLATFQICIQKGCENLPHPYTYFKPEICVNGNTQLSLGSSGMLSTKTFLNLQKI